ncbi:hypothetical protein ACQCLI_32090 (plasmid) [Pseudomonas nitroreducens]|uniref:hypothetical protein n=1 Tax=Pseudomonas nitroreducens TaxID=46680 RepID=UPI00037D1960|nr:hypothetical protein [Pseudomonas nitroreducens]
MSKKQEQASPSPESATTQTTLADLEARLHKAEQELSAAQAEIAVLTATQTYNLCRCGEQCPPVVTHESNSLGKFLKAACPSCKKSVSTFTEPGLISLWNTFAKKRRPVCSDSQASDQVRTAIYELLRSTYVNGYQAGQQDARTKNNSNYHPSGAAHEGMGVLVGLLPLEALQFE